MMIELYQIAYEQVECNPSNLGQVFEDGSRCAIMPPLSGWIISRLEASMQDFQVRFNVEESKMKDYSFLLFEFEDFYRIRIIYSGKYDQELFPVPYGAVYNCHNNADGCDFVSP